MPRANVSSQRYAAAIAVWFAVTAAAPPRADGSFRGLYQALVETDTSLASGNCTAAARRLADAMISSGFPKAGLHSYATKDHPKEGGLVAILRGSDRGAKALLLIAHIDVVEADRAGWKRDPFVLTEEGGYFYGRGVSDNKAVAAALVDALIRLHGQGFRPRRDVKVALTCGEESAAAFNGADYLATHQRSLIDAGLALVPTAGAELDDRGKRVALTLQAGEKVQQNFRLEAQGIGSHASRPTDDNAIYMLAEALLRLRHYSFPIELNAATRLYFDHAASVAQPAYASAIRALLADPNDRVAQAAVTANSSWNAMLRTTCVATMLDTGRQANTVAPRASANINCRLLPGQAIAGVQGALVKLLTGPGMTLTLSGPVSVTPPSPPITRAVVGPIEHVTKAMWPGVAVVPAMLTGATDARHFNAAGIPTYGLTVMFSNPDGDGVHAVDERIRVRSVQEGREFLYRLIASYAAGGGRSEGR